MKLFAFSILATFLFVFSSCLEIVDDISINDDGSGTFKYTVNLSSSKVKINSILALDSLDGKKVPSVSSIQNKLKEIKVALSNKKGVSNVDFQSDYTNYIFKLKCDFTSLEELQSAVSELAISENKGRDIPELRSAWLKFQNDSLVRSIPHITIEKASQINKRDTGLLKEGSYTSITRFNKAVDTFTNNFAKLSKNRKAVMVRTNPYLLTQNPQFLDNSIFLQTATH